MRWPILRSTGRAGVGVNSNSTTLTIFALGLLVAALTFVINGPVAVFAGRLSTWFQSRLAALAWLTGAAAWSWWVSQFVWRSPGALMPNRLLKIESAALEAPQSWLRLEQNAPKLHKYWAV